MKNLDLFERVVSEYHRKEEKLRSSRQVIIDKGVSSNTRDLRSYANRNRTQRSGDVIIY